jgi:hypothetical protein
VGDHDDVMAVQPVRPALRLLSGRAGSELLAWLPAVVLAWRGESFLYARRWWRSRCASGPDLSCEAETCRSRRRLVVRGGDFSCEVETSRAR